MNALMILVALRLGGRKVRPLRVGFGAVFGAGMAWAARVSSTVRAAALWLPAAACMMCIAGGRRRIWLLVQDAALLLCAGGLLGGLVLCIYGATGSLEAAYAVCAALSLWMAASRLRGSALPGGGCRVECHVQERTMRFEAIIDTGNTLRDYLTKRPVIVLPEASAEARSLAEGVSSRLIFADTAGGRQMMRLFLPDKVVLIVGGTKRNVCAAVALAPALDARSPALVPSGMTDDG